MRAVTGSLGSGNPKESKDVQQILPALLRLLERENVPMTRTLVEHQLVKEGGGWKIAQLDRAALDAMTLASEVDVQRQRLNDAAVQAFNRQVVTAVETFLVDNEFNQAFDLTGRDTTAGAVAGACAFGVGVSRAPSARRLGL